MHAEQHWRAVARHAVPHGWVLSIASHNPPAKDNPWVRLTADGVPREAVSIWPASTWPTFKIPAAGIWRGGDWANSFWISPSRAAFEQKAQELFDDQGRRLIHVHTYREGSARRWAGIARSGNWANSFFIGSDLDSFNRTAQDLFDDKGRRLIAVEFLDD